MQMGFWATLDDKHERLSRAVHEAAAAAMMARAGASAADCWATVMDHNIIHSYRLCELAIRAIFRRGELNTLVDLAKDGYRAEVSYCCCPGF